MLNNIEELLINAGANEGLIWEVKHFLEPSDNYVRLQSPSLCIYIFKESPRYLYFIPQTDPTYRGIISRVGVSSITNEMPGHLIEDPNLHPLLEEALRYLTLPEGYIYHVLCELKLIDTLYQKGPELYAAWSGGEFVTFINGSNWDIKKLHLETLVSLRDHLPKDVNETLLNLIQCRLPLPPTTL